VTQDKSSSAEAPESGPKPLYPIESVDNALKLILLISDRPQLRMTDASRYLGVALSTAHRLLAMLEYRGFVRHDPATRAYVAGPMLDTIAFAALRGMDVRTIARPVLARLNAELAETVHLGQLQGNFVRFIDAIESPRATRVASRLGMSMPAHCTSTGKALLAQLTEDELRLLYPAEELERMTARSLARRTDLERELGKVRSTGHATNREESEEGVSSVAVAIVSQHSHVHLAINVATPTSRASAASTRQSVAALEAAAAEIAVLL
jgi:DNA-binding IclR family transcriptional regulator